MQLRSIFIATGLAFGLLVGASTVEAAKGVKKNVNQNGEHHHHGKVIEVNHKLGHMVIVTHHHTKKKAGQTNTKSNNVATHHIKFSISTNTKFTSEHGKQKQPTTFKALHVGEHVSVAAHQHHADAVVIHHLAAKTQKKGIKKKINVNVN